MDIFRGLWQLLVVQGKEQLPNESVQTSCNEESLVPSDRIRTTEHFLSASLRVLCKDVSSELPFLALSPDHVLFEHLSMTHARMYGLNCCDVPFLKVQHVDCRFPAAVELLAV